MIKSVSPGCLRVMGTGAWHSPWGKCLGIGMIVLASVAGCADRNKNDIPESPATSGEIEKSVDKAGKVVEKAAEKTGTVVEKAAKATGAVLEDSAMSTKIKAALMANKMVDASNINVDTKNNIVYLRGSVRNEAQRNLAVAITKKNAAGYSINNLLQIPGKATGVPAKAAAKAPAKAPAKPH